jgi:hypothetical protein
VWLQHTFAETNSGEQTNQTVNNDTTIIQFTFKNPSLQYSKTNVGAYAAIGIMVPLKHSWYVKTDIEYRYGFTPYTITREFSGKSTKPPFSFVTGTSSQWHANNARLNVGIVRKF